MGKAKRRFVAKAEVRQGWRIWDNTTSQWWGERYCEHPAALVAELNGGKRPERLVALQTKEQKKRRKT